jgi:hypothetical protein
MWIGEANDNKVPIFPKLERLLDIATIAIISDGYAIRGTSGSGSHPNGDPGTNGYDWDQKEQQQEIKQY